MKITSEENTNSKVNNNFLLLRYILQCPKQEGTDGGEAQHFPRPVGLAELLGSEWSSELLCSSTPFSWTS